MAPDGFADLRLPDAATRYWLEDLNIEIWTTGKTLYTAVHNINCVSWVGSVRDNCFTFSFILDFDFDILTSPLSLNTDAGTGDSWWENTHLRSMPMTLDYMRLVSEQSDNPCFIRFSLTDIVTTLLDKAHINFLASLSRTASSVSDNDSIWRNSSGHNVGNALWVVATTQRSNAHLKPKWRFLSVLCIRYKSASHLFLLSRCSSRSLFMSPSIDVTFDTAGSVKTQSISISLPVDGLWGTCKQGKWQKPLMLFNYFPNQIVNA